MHSLILAICILSVCAAAVNGDYNYQQAGPVAQQSFRPSPTFGNSPAFEPAPPPSQYIPPQNENYQQQHAPPPHQSNGPAAPPQQLYGPPAPPQQLYGPPAPPQQLYGPPAPPQQLYGPPALPQHIAPSPHVSAYIPPAPRSPYQQHQPPPTILTKNFYLHAGPEETEDFNAQPDLEPEPKRKNYHVLFIKAPSHNLRITNNYVKSQAQKDEKTIIYVLAKKPDITTIQNQISSPHGDQKDNKPEVYFIKYKTLEEASRAQQEIRAQYEALGGSTSVSDEGLSPVRSVIGSGNSGNNPSNFGQSTNNNPQIYAAPPSLAYLPPHKK